MAVHGSEVFTGDGVFYSQIWISCTYMDTKFFQDFLCKLWCIRNVYNEMIEIKFNLFV